mgnify:CR=1 FL=1
MRPSSWFFDASTRSQLPRAAPVMAAHAPLAAANMYGWPSRLQLDRYEELRNARTAVSWYGNPLIPPPITWHIRNVSQLAAHQTWQLIGGGSNKVVYRARTLRPYDSSGRRSVIVKKARQSSSELLAEISFLEHTHRT